MTKFNYIALGAVLLTAGTYAGISGALYMNQEKIIFPREVNPITLAHKDKAEELWLTTPDNIKLSGIGYKAAEEKAPLVLAFGGNAHDVAGFVEYLMYDIYTDRVAHCAGFSYRGYPNALGYESEGEPSQEAIYADALEIYDAMVEKYKPSAVHVVGYSLGTSVGAYVATQRPVDSLTMITPFTSMAAIAKNHYPWLPVNFLLKHKLPTDELIKGVTAPVTMIHAGNDEIVPHDHAHMLPPLVPNLKANVTLETGHTDIFDAHDFPEILRKAW